MQKGPKVADVAQGTGNDDDGSVVRALVADVLLLRFGEGLAGLAAGQGLTLVLCPPGVDGFTGDTFLVVASTGDAAADRLATVLALAEAVLERAGLPNGPAEQWCFAAALAVFEGEPQK